MSSQILDTISDRSPTNQLGERLPPEIKDIEEDEWYSRRTTMKHGCRQRGFFTLGIGLALLGVFGGISAGLQTSTGSDAQSMAAGPEVEVVASIQDSTTNED